jgi:excisionase family DNA binding protein
LLWRVTVDKRLSVSLLAEQWGCSKQHVYNLIERGELSYLRIGNLIRFRPEDIAEYEDRQCHAPMPSNLNTASLASTVASMSSGGKMGAHTAFLAGQRSQRKRVAS